MENLVFAADKNILINAILAKNYLIAIVCMKMEEDVSKRS